MFSRNCPICPAKHRQYWNSMQAFAASAIMAITTRLSFIMFGKESGSGRVVIREMLRRESRPGKTTTAAGKRHSSCANTAAAGKIHDDMMITWAILWRFTKPLWKRPRKHTKAVQQMLGLHPSFWSEQTTSPHCATLSHTEHIRIHNHLKWIWVKTPAITCKITQKSLASRHVHPGDAMVLTLLQGSRPCVNSAVGRHTRLPWATSHPGPGRSRQLAWH